MLLDLSLRVGAVDDNGDRLPEKIGLRDLQERRPFDLQELFRAEGPAEIRVIDVWNATGGTDRVHVALDGLHQRRVGARRDDAADRGVGLIQNLSLFNLDIPDEEAVTYGQGSDVELDMLPPDLAGMVQQLQQYEFTSSEAREKFDAIAICDEVWEHVMFDGRRHVPLIAMPGMRERCLRLGSAGKTFSLTGWKVGYVSAAPALLAWLADDFMRNGYNLKHTIRLILTSRTYQLKYDPALEDRSLGSYMILERGDSPGEFFKKFPRHRTLISSNKVYTGYDDPEVNLRFDWNSILSDDAPLPFKEYTRKYFPDADTMVKYLCDYAECSGLKVMVNTQRRYYASWRAACAPIRDGRGRKAVGLERGAASDGVGARGVAVVNNDWAYEDLLGCHRNAGNILAIAYLGAAIGAGLAAIGAGVGIGRLAAGNRQ